MLNPKVTFIDGPALGMFAMNPSFVPTRVQGAVTCVKDQKCVLKLALKAGLCLYCTFIMLIFQIFQRIMYQH